MTAKVTDLALVKNRVERLVAEELSQRMPTTDDGQAVVRKANASNRVAQTLTDLEVSGFKRDAPATWPETARNEIFGFVQMAHAACAFSVRVCADLLQVHPGELDAWITSEAYKTWVEAGDHLAMKEDAVRNLALDFAADLLTRRSNNAAVISQQRHVAELFLGKVPRRSKNRPAAHANAGPGKPVVDV